MQSLEVYIGSQIVGEKAGNLYHGQMDPEIMG